MKHIADIYWLSNGRQDILRSRGRGLSVLEIGPIYYG
jgi:hypothetical protein